MPEFGVALIFSGIATAIGASLASATGDPDVAFRGFFFVAGASVVVGLAACMAPMLSARLPPVPGTTAPPARRTPALGDEPQLRVTVEASLELIKNQYVQCGSLEAQLVGFIAVLAAAVGAVLAIKPTPHEHLWIPYVGGAASIVACLVGLFGTGELDSGMIPRWFYDSSAGSQDYEFLDALSIELDGAAENNQDGLDKRRGALALALMFVVVTAAAWILAG
jgi:hypothetical protein